MDPALHGNKIPLNNYLHSKLHLVLQILKLVLSTDMKYNYIFIKTNNFVFQGTYHIFDVTSDIYTFKSEFTLPDMTNTSPLSIYVFKYALPMPSVE